MNEHLAAHAPRSGFRPKRILIGVTGEGWGHTMRARTLAGELRPPLSFGELLPLLPRRAAHSKV